MPPQRASGAAGDVEQEEAQARPRTGLAQALGITLSCVCSASPIRTARPSCPEAKANTKWTCSCQLGDDISHLNV